MKPAVAQASVQRNIGSIWPYHPTPHPSTPTCTLSRLPSPASRPPPCPTVLPCRTQIVSEAKPGLRYTAWRRPLRGGLYMYRASAVLAGVSPREVRAFHMDDDIRCAVVGAPAARIARERGGQHM